MAQCATMVMSVNASQGVQAMKAITIRGIDVELDEKLKQTSKEKHKSVNQLIIDLLSQSLGIQKKRVFTREYHDLDHLFGRWTEDQFERIEKAIDDQRRLDEELWS